MNIVEFKVKDLIPYAKNPRKNDSSVDAVAKSISEFGFKIPIVIDSKNTIVCGHTRLKAAKKIGMETVPCIVADDLTEDQLKAFRLVDNKTSELSEWDFDMLALELNDLSNIDMSAFGFNLDEVADEIIGETTFRDLPEDDFEGEGKNQKCTCPACGFTFEL